MKKQIGFVLVALMLMVGLAQAQVPSMPGPGGTLINAQAATTTSPSFSISGYGVTTFQTITAAAATGTVTYQGSLDNVNWSTLTCWLNGTTTAASTTAVTGATASALLTCNTDGIPVVRAVLSPWSGGTWTVNIGTSYMPRAK